MPPKERSAAFGQKSNPTPRKSPLNVSDSQQMVVVTLRANLLTWEPRGWEQGKHKLSLPYRSSNREGLEQQQCHVTDFGAVGEIGESTSFAAHHVLTASRRKIHIICREPHHFIYKTYECIYICVHFALLLTYSLFFRLLCFVLFVHTGYTCYYQTTVMALGGHLIEHCPGKHLPRRCQSSPE